MIRKAAILCSIVFALLLTACGAGGGSSNSDSANSQAADTNLTAEEEIVITATNYSFDQKEYHLKKGVPVKSSSKTRAATTAFLCLR